MPKNSWKILAEEWFKKARDDYKSAKVVLEEGGYYGTTCFLSQQIAEKYLLGLPRLLTRKRVSVFSTSAMTAPNRTLASRASIVLTVDLVLMFFLSLITELIS